MTAFPPQYLSDVRRDNHPAKRQPMKDITPPPPALPKPKGKKRMAILPHEYLLPDCA